MKIFYYGDAPYPTTITGGCCGAFLVSPPPQVGVEEFEKVMAGARYGGYVLENCTPGLWVLKGLLSLSHPLVKDVLGGLGSGWVLLPFENKFFVFRILEGAKMPFLEGVKALSSSTPYPFRPTSITEKIYSLPGSPYGVKTIKSQLIHPGVYYAVTVAEEKDVCPYDVSSVATWQAAGFTSWPFTHRIHSGTPRRMIFQTLLFGGGEQKSKRKYEMTTTKYELPANYQGSPRNVKVYLSRRNLLTLLSKLDRVKAGEKSAKTLIKHDILHKEFPQTHPHIEVTAVEDKDYYTDRAAGYTIENLSATTYGEKR